MSTDDLAAHRAFAARHQLTYPLVADTAGRLAGAFGVPLTHGYAHRVTFVVDRTGHIARVFSPVDPQHHTPEVLAALRALTATQPAGATTAAPTDRPTAAPRSAPR